MLTPQSVVIEPPRLDPDAKGILLSALISIALRTLLVWAAIAILFPGFGITYWMVYVAIVGIAALKGPRPYALIHSANRVSRARRERRLARGDTTLAEVADEALLRSRST